MRGMIREERGSALLLVVFMMFVFTMIGLAILSATVGGAQRSVTREKDVQSLELAEKALTEAVAYIYAKYDNRTDISFDQIKSDMSAIESKIKDRTISSNIKITDTLNAFARITDINVTLPPGKQEYVIKLSALADVDGVKRTLVQEIMVDAFPDFLKYAMGSQDNVNLHGGAYIKGNLYAGKQLRIKNEADYKYYGKPLTKSTLFPRVAAGKTTFVQSLGDIRYCDRGNSSDACGTYVALGKGDTDLGERVQKILGIPLQNFELQDNKAFVEMNIGETFVDKAVEAAGVDQTNRGSYASIFNNNGGPALFQYLLTNKMIGVAKAPVSQDFYTDEDDADGVVRYIEARKAYVKMMNGQWSQSTLYNGTLLLDAASEFKQLTYSSLAKSQYSPLSSGKGNKSNWFIINGDLAINNQVDDPVQLKGNFLVTGNVTIKGKLNVDATVIALGTTTIEDAVIKGMNDNGTEKELVLLSKGPINIHRFDSFNPIVTNYNELSAGNPAIMDAYFYTDQEASLYGVGSAFWIKGGFFSKGELTVNATIGNAEQNLDEANPAIIFSSENANPDPKENNYARSRLIIEWKEDLINNQNSSLPRVKRINLYSGKKHFAEQ
ncbi:hypothetical protein D7Z26_04325 [Cohnella endophytica]|uniref:Uncharacterized protein n=1 Tax=Cohnella endophytica TaxID=2419778 RepID=A0A494Y3A1_9BACL|nr:hypothetical protein [Cohnella endophytica]RKP57216.1 hypothetical protein D7Z26_04325 [Cohnella endophytica]